jgi:FkbM family methyltransferase
MLLDFEKIIKKYNLNIKGIIHIGAHYGQEHKLYTKNEIKNIIYFEPLSDNFLKLKNNVNDEATLYNMALGCENKEIEMFVESNNKGQSSSILEPILHLKQYPNITFDKKEKVIMKKLDDIEIDYEKFNFINIDVQGYELEVFCGAKNVLEKIDYIISEVNRAELYKDCAKINELEQFLNNFGFELAEVDWVGNTWGDAFFIKKIYK